MCSFMICFAAYYVITPYADDLDQQVLAVELCNLLYNLTE